MTRQECLELLPLYAAGALSAAEGERVRAWLAKGDPELLASLAEVDAVFASLARSLPAIDPPAHLKSKVLARIGELGQRAKDHSHLSIATPTHESSRGRSFPVLGYAAAAVILIALSGAILFVAFAREYARQVASKEQQLDETEKRIQSLDAALADAQGRYQQLARQLAEGSARIDQLESLLGSQGLSVVELAGLPAPEKPASDVGGRVMYNAQDQAALVYVYNLAPPGKGKVYQLWFITDQGEKIPSDTFNVNAARKSSLVVRVPQGAKFTHAAVTDEPEGGVQSPTGQIHLIGELK